jgi:hypothetical protein
MLERRFRLGAERGEVTSTVLQALKPPAYRLPVASPRGVRGVEGKVRGSRVTLRLARTWIAGANDSLALKASITGGESGSDPTMVVARISRAHAPWIAPALFLGVGVAAGMGGDTTGAWALAGLALLILVLDLLRRAGPENDAETRYLDAWLTAVLGPLRMDQPSSPDGGSKLLVDSQ